MQPTTITIYSPNGNPAASITLPDTDQAIKVITTIYETISKQAEPLVFTSRPGQSLDEWIADNPAEWARMKGIEELRDRDA